MSRRSALLVASLFASIAPFAGACGGGATRGPRPLPSTIASASVSASASGEARVGPVAEQPPASSASKESPFPKVVRATLANGLSIATVEAHALPIVQLRVSIRAGIGYGGIPGAAEITAQLLKDGGTRRMTSAKLLDTIETLGASLSVGVDLDGTTLAMGVTRDQLAEGIGILADIVRSPRFDEGELKKLKDRETDDAEESARADGTWAATRVLFRQLFPAASPYASAELTPPEIAKITGAVVRDFHKRFYVPKNVAVVVVGDVAAAEVASAVERGFGAWKGGEPPAVEFPAVQPFAVTGNAASARRVVVAHRPKSVQSDVFVVTLAPERTSPEWPALRVASQVLGGGPASRLFADVREQRSLAYTTRTSILELAHGAQPLLAYAGTQTPKTALAVQGLLENIDKIGSQPIGVAEVESARRLLSDIFAIRMETVGSVADMIVTQRELGLPDGYWDAYRAEVRSVDAARASSEAVKVFGRTGSAPHAMLIIVSGDADVIAAPLSHFGDVSIVDPEQGFRETRVVPMNTAAPLAPR
jgi:zinc protease